MVQYECQKCGSNEFVTEMRRIIIKAGYGGELEVAGMVSVHQCAADGCIGVGTSYAFDYGPRIEATTASANPIDEVVSDERVLN